MNILRVAAFSSLVLAMSLQPGSGLAADKYSSWRATHSSSRPTTTVNRSADPPRPSSQFNSASNQKPYSGLKSVPMTPAQK